MIHEDAIKSKLDPCPICGSTDVEVKRYTDDWGHLEEIIIACKTCEYCVDCGYEKDFEEKAVKAWNASEMIRINTNHGYVRDKIKEWFHEY